MESNRKQKIATALKYEAGENAAPKLIAKGKGVVAENIVEKAEEHGVPVYHDEKLSNQLYNLSLGEEIPQELYQVIAEVLAFIARLDQGRK